MAGGFRPGRCATVTAKGCVQGLPWRLERRDNLTETQVYCYTENVPYTPLL